MTAAPRDRNPEGCAEPGFAFDRHAAAVQFDKLLDERQADTRSFLSSAFGTFHPMKTLEQPRYLVRRDTDAGVANRQDEVVVLHSELYFDRTVQGELEGVGQKIEHDFFPHLAIDMGKLRQGRRNNDEVETCLLCSRTEYARKLRSCGGEVRWLKHGLGAACLYA